jgi:hypothetical protein
LALSISRCFWVAVSLRVVLHAETVSPDLIFKTGELNYTNTNTTTENGNPILELTLNSTYGLFPGNADQPATTAFMCVGELAINHYPPKTRKVVLVPVNGAGKIGGIDIKNITSEMATAISNIYAPANMAFTVEMGKEITVPPITAGMEDSETKNPPALPPT